MSSNKSSTEEKAKPARAPKSGGADNWFFSVVGVILVAVLLVFLNSAFKDSRAKIDATEFKIHTLTQGTKNILKDLDGQLGKFDDGGERNRLTIRLFANFDKQTIPAFFTDYAEKVEAKLREIQAFSDDRIELEVIDPKPFFEEEETASLNGVFPVPLDQDTRVYLGLSVSSLNKSVAVPFLNPQNANLLEYEIARAITDVVVTKKPTVGLMTTYPMSGGPALGPGAPPSQPWYFRAQLERDYKVQDVPISVDKIDPNIDALIIVHPAGIEDSALFAIDQYLLGGGRVLAMLDPYSIINRQASGQQRVPGMPAPGNQPLTSTLPKLLDAWGIQFESVNVVADRQFVHRNPQQQNPLFITVPGKAINDDFPATEQINYLEFTLAGAFYGDGKTGLEKEILVTSSEDAGTISPYSIMDNPQGAAAAFNSMETTPTPKELVIQLQGDFETAFKDGPPVDETKVESGEGEEKKAPTGDWLTESEKTGTVILIADTDMISDQNAARVMSVGNGQQVEFPPPNGNLALVSNLIGYLAGNSNLLEVRSRGDNTRPFTEYERLTEETALAQRREFDELVEKRETALRQYNDIRQRQMNGEEVDASEAELVNNFTKEQTKANERIVELNRELRRGIDRLEASYKWINIALIPGLVILAAMIHLLIRRSTTSAR